MSIRNTITKFKNDHYVIFMTALLLGFFAICVGAMALMAGIVDDMNENSSLSKYSEYCEANGIDLEELSFCEGEDYSNQKFTKYMLIKGTCSETEPAVLTELVSGLEELKYEGNNRQWDTVIFLNGDRYRTDRSSFSIDDSETLTSTVLICNSEEIYNSEQAKINSMLIDLAQKPPYPGLKEEYLSKTILGAPDHIEEESSRYYYGKYKEIVKEYEWYDSDGNWICTLDTTNWDSRNKKLTTRYVRNTNYWGQYESIYKEYEGF